jgi:hypothetical protein
MYNKKNFKNDKNTILKKDNSLRIRDKDGSIPMFEIINRKDFLPTVKAAARGKQVMSARTT